MLKDTEWVRSLFRCVDDMNVEALLDFLEDDAIFRFGSEPAVRGKDAIGQAIRGFFASIKGLSHEVLETWFHPETILCQGEVTYTRNDDSSVGLPFANIWRLRGDLVAEYLIYVDAKPLYSADS